MKKAVVLFPGIRYSCDTPLLYFAGVVFGQRGYEKYEIDYSGRMQSANDLEQAVLAVRQDVLSQLASMKLEDYDQVVFVSKSIGTVLAGWAASQLPYPIRHIYLTPLEQTLPFIDPVKDWVVGAGDDPYLASDRLSAYCAERGISLTIYPGVEHRLEDKGDVHRTLQILTEIVELYEQY